MVDVPRQENQRKRIALGKFITSTGRFKADRQQGIVFLTHKINSKDTCI